MPGLKIVRKKIIRGLKTLRFYTYVFFLIIFVLLGTWCLPPKWFEKVLDEIKAKFTVEKIEDVERLPAKM